MSNDNEIYPLEREWMEGARNRGVEDTDNLELLRGIENSEGDGTEEALTPYGAKCVADELERLRRVTANAETPCPHVRTSAEGTSYCTLAESDSAVPDEVRRAAEAEARIRELEEVPEQWADWLLDAVATATQDRRFLRGDDEYDDVAGEAILRNAEKAIRKAMKEWDNERN